MFWATTAHREFWGGRQALVFLGDWCLNVTGGQDLAGISWKQARHPWEEAGAQENALEFSRRYYDAAMEALTQGFNTIHGETHSRRYWELIIGPWLIHFIQITLERYACIKSALERDPDFETIGLDDRDFRIPDGFTQLSYSSVLDGYNVQLYTQILDTLGKKPPSVRVSIARPNPPNLKHGLLGKIRSKFLPRNGGVLFAGLPITRSDQVKLIIRSGFLLRPFRLDELQYEHSPFEVDLFSKTRRMVRTTLESIDRSSLGVTLAALTSWNFPMRYLEHYKSHQQRIEYEIAGTPRAIMASTWLPDENLRLLAARSIERGTVLIGVQHGGGYGTHHYMVQEEIERALVDTYLTWGWEGRPSRPSLSSTIPVPVPGISRLRAKSNKSKTNGPFLFVANDYPRYIHRINCAPRPPHLPAYWEWQLRFFRCLPSSILTRILYRSHPSSGTAIYNFEDINRRTIRNIGLRTGPKKESYETQFQAAQIILVDVNSTVFLEGVACNRPTIAFWDPAIYRIRDDAAPYFETLRSVDILHDSPESAAKHLAKVAEDPSKWWNGQKLQEARIAFSEQHARTSTAWQTVWLNSIRDALDDAPSPINPT